MHDTDRRAGCLATLEHARSLAVKAKEFDAQARKLRGLATKAFVVAAELSDALSYDELEAAHRGLKVDGVPCRRPISDALQRRFVVRTTAVGSVVRRPRWPGGEPWPKGFVVYCLVDKRNEVIYVGKTRNMAGRITAHVKKPWVNADIIICADEQQALRLEGDLIYQHRPMFNVADTRKRRFVA